MLARLSEDLETRVGRIDRFTTVADTVDFLTRAGQRRGSQPRWESSDCAGGEELRFQANIKNRAGFSNGKGY